MQVLHHKGRLRPFPWVQQSLNLWHPDYESGESISEILAFWLNDSHDLGRSAFSIISKCSPSDTNRSFCYIMIHIAFCPIPILVIFRIFEIMISWKCRYIYFEQVIIVIHLNGPYIFRWFYVQRVILPLNFIYLFHVGFRIIDSIVYWWKMKKIIIIIRILVEYLPATV